MLSNIIIVCIVKNPKYTKYMNILHFNEPMRYGKFVISM